MWLPGAREQPELARRARERAIDHVGWEQDALAVADCVAGSQAKLEQALAHPRPAHLDTDLGQNVLGFVEHLDDQFVGDYVKKWTHHYLRSQNSGVRISNGCAMPGGGTH